MTLGIDVSPLFSEMVMERFSGGGGCFGQVRHVLQRLRSCKTKHVATARLNNGPLKGARCDRLLLRVASCILPENRPIQAKSVHEDKNNPLLSRQAQASATTDLVQKKMVVDSELC